MQNVLNTLRVLEEVAARQPAGVAELARATGIPKSSVQRALRTLRTTGWIRPAGGGITRWAVTTKALYVGRHAAGGLSLRDVAGPWRKAFSGPYLTSRRDALILLLMEY
jgi:IclR family acetate operon transcriptional repressor